MNEDISDFVLQFLDRAHVQWERAIQPALIYEGDLIRKKFCHTRHAYHHDHIRGDFELLQVRLGAWTTNGLMCWKCWTLFQEHRPEPVASESIVFLSEKMMERSTSRSLFHDLADGES